MAEWTISLGRSGIHRLSAMPNIYRPEFEEGERPEGFRGRRARIGYELGTELIGASLWEVPPGEAAYPYHFHYADEELVIVISGRPSLRTPEGTRELEMGEAIHFPLGEEGGHQILNQTDEVATFLAISSHGRPDVVRLSRFQQDRRWGTASKQAVACAPSSPETPPSTIGPARSRQPPIDHGGFR